MYMGTGAVWENLTCGIPVFNPIGDNCCAASKSDSDGGHTKCKRLQVHQPEDQKAV